MIERSDEEILAKCRELWPEEYMRDTEYEVSRQTGYISLRISQMYESPGLSFAKLLALAEFFDTMNVETGSEFHHGGCETCDYGSEVGFTLYVRPGDPFQRPSEQREGSHHGD